MDQNTEIATRARLTVRRHRPAHRRSTRSRWLGAMRGLLPAASRAS